MAENNNPQFPSQNSQDNLSPESSQFSSSNTPSNSFSKQDSSPEGSFQTGQAYSQNGEPVNNSLGASWQQQSVNPQTFNQWDEGAQSPKKSKVGLIIGILVAVIALFGVVLAIGIGVWTSLDSRSTSDSPTRVSTSVSNDEEESKSATGPKVEYIVTADFPVKIRFSDNLGSHQENFAGGESAWTKSYNLEDDYAYLQVSVTPEKDDFENTQIMTCEIKIDGKTVKKSDGEYSVSCDEDYEAD